MPIEPALLPGTVASVVSHLTVWLSHSRPGIVWVEFMADLMRDVAAEELASLCRTRGWPLTTIRVAQAATRDDWTNVRDRIESVSGVVNVIFSGVLGSRISHSASIHDFALALNLDRERIFAAEVRQIWWVSQDFARNIRPFAPDFLSWVNARFRLDELPPIREIVDTEAAFQASSIAVPEQTAGLIEPPLEESVRWKNELSRRGDAVYRARLQPERAPSSNPDLASALAELAEAQQQNGQLEQALASLSEAVAILRTLLSQDRERFTLGLARALNTLSLRQSDLGLRQQALSSIQEAVALYRYLAAAQPHAFGPNLSLSLTNLSNQQSALGQREQALCSIQEAVALQRDLAAARPDSFRPDLAMSLNNLSNQQSALGQREQALSSIQEAVALYSYLAAAQPHAFGPDLSLSLTNLSNQQSALGQREQALSSIEQAVAINRELVAVQADVFSPDLADSLNNLAVQQNALGQREQALSSVEEAVSLYRDLAKAHPEIFIPNLARSLGVLGATFSSLDDFDQARQATIESLAALSGHFLRFPAAFGGLGAALVRDYLEYARKLDQPPDQNLLEAYLPYLQEADSSLPRPQLTH